MRQGGKNSCYSFSCLILSKNTNPYSLRLTPLSSSCSKYLFTLACLSLHHHRLNRCTEKKVFMQEQDTSKVDFTNAFGTLCLVDFEVNKSTAKPETVQKRKIQALPTDSTFALMKLPQVLAHMQVSRSCWLDGVRKGRYPEPVRLSERRVAWRVSDLKAFVDSL